LTEQKLNIRKLDDVKALHVNFQQTRVNVIELFFWWNKMLGCVLYNLYFLFLFFFSEYRCSTATFLVDTITTLGPWNHFWEECVGSGHASTTLRADWQQQMTQTHLDLGFKQVDK
jgi:hypothetical protein